MRCESCDVTVVTDFPVFADLCILSRFLSILSSFPTRKRLFSIVRSMSALIIDQFSTSRYCSRACGTNLCMLRSLCHRIRVYPAGICHHSRAPPHASSAPTASLRRLSARSSVRSALAAAFRRSTAQRLARPVIRAGPHSCAFVSCFLSRVCELGLLLCFICIFSASGPSVPNHPKSIFTHYSFQADNTSSKCKICDTGTYASTPAWPPPCKPCSIGYFQYTPKVSCSMHHFLRIYCILYPY